MSYILQRPGRISQTWHRDKLTGLGSYQLQRTGQISQVWRRDKLAGLGTAEFLGPDQPWTAQTASTWITQRTRQCEGGKEILIGGLTPPKYTTDGKTVKTAQCYATGRVKESAKAGYQRVQEWCCPVDRPTAPVTKPVTQAQAEQYATLCDDKPLTASGQPTPTTLGWWLLRGQSMPTGMCRESGVTDGDYRLLCCRQAESLVVMKDGKAYAPKLTISSKPQTTTAQIEDLTQRQAEQAARTEAALIAAQEPSYSIWERYKWVIILGGGAMAFGLLAGGIKKRLSKKAGG